MIEGGETIDQVLMKKLRNKVRSGLPFDYQGSTEVKVPIIDRFELCDLADWNAGNKQYPIRVKGNGNATG